MESIFRGSSRIYPAFQRIVNLEASTPKMYSKSVTETIRKIPPAVNFEIVNYTNDRSRILKAMEDLKNLHFVSAGTLTRSEHSWNIQHGNIVNGSAFISEVQLDDRVIASTYFMLSGSRSYYGVSAFNREYSGISPTHLAIHHAMSYLQQCRKGYLFLGPQYSDKSSLTTNKVASIEKFKSFFGGN
jgi:hypothetical protein